MLPEPRKGGFAADLSPESLSAVRRSLVPCRPSATQCFCGWLEDLGSEASNCDMACAGDETQLCGGFDAISVYEFYSEETSTSGETDGYLGCFQDGNGNRLMTEKAVSSAMTAEVIPPDSGQGLKKSDLRFFVHIF